MPQEESQRGQRKTEDFYPFFFALTEVESLESFPTTITSIKAIIITICASSFSLSSFLLRHNGASEVDSFRGVERDLEHGNRFFKDATILGGQVSLQVSTSLLFFYAAVFLSCLFCLCKLSWLFFLLAQKVEEVESVEKRRRRMKAQNQT